MIKSCTNIGDILVIRFRDLIVLKLSFALILGINQLGVAVNKMDNVKWSQERFNEVRKKLTSFLRQVGFRDDDVTYVPCSGLTGENLIKNPDEPALKSWYSGPTLVDLIGMKQILFVSLIE